MASKPPPSMPSTFIAGSSRGVAAGHRTLSARRAAASASLSHPRVTLRPMSFAPPWSLSPSSCSSFMECPLAFRFSYLERLPEPPAPWTTKGTLVHRALELLLDRPADERSLDAGLSHLAQDRVELAPHPVFADLDLTDEEWAKFYAESESLVNK